MTNDGGNEMDGLEARDDQELWTLLGRQEPPVKASPYFARRVWREVTRAEERRVDGWWRRVVNVLPSGTWARRAALGSGGLSGVCAAFLLVLTHGGQTPGRTGLPKPAEVVAVSPVETMAAIAGPTDVAPAVAVPVDGDPRAAVSAQDVEVIADLDNVLQREESRLWTEDTARF